MLNNIRYSIAKSTCQKQVAQVIELMQGHKSAGRPSGDLIYKRLQNRVLSALSDLQNEAKKLGFEEPTLASLEEGIPALRELDMLTSAATPQVVPIGLTVLAGGVVVTITLAFFRNLYILLTHFHWLSQ